ncbi:hypothetical protein AD947_08890 [Acetobacter tropicalis]|uniref:Uncharacterized protein n=1 Tax=Acetobacter tropicalis TaxID=104102 RepID=A0A149TW20_9PROT|nr:hypothetical protein AD947_08890 [Acetobacter tropicalis]
MISLCVFVAWACAFWAHERLQPRTCKLFPLAQSRRKAYQLLRFCGPVLALFLCLYWDFEKGLLYWFGGIGRACRQHPRGHPEAHAKQATLTERYVYAPISGDMRSLLYHIRYQARRVERHSRKLTPYLDSRKDHRKRRSETTG